MTYTKTYFTWLSIMFAVVSVFNCQSMGAQQGIEAPPMPPGYESENQIKLAILTGLLKIVDAKNVPVPDSVQEIKGLEYGKVGQRSLHLDLYRPKTDKRPPQRSDERKWAEFGVQTQAFSL